MKKSIITSVNAWKQGSKINEATTPSTSDLGVWHNAELPAGSDVKAFIKEFYESKGLTNQKYLKMNDHSSSGEIWVYFNAMMCGIATPAENLFQWKDEDYAALNEYSNNPEDGEPSVPAVSPGTAVADITGPFKEFLNSFESDMSGLMITDLQKLTPMEIDQSNAIDGYVMSDIDGKERSLFFFEEDGEFAIQLDDPASNTKARFANPDEAKMRELFNAMVGKINVTKAVESATNESWTDTVQNTYGSLEELEAFDEIYGIVKRLGFESAVDLWEKNPKISGSTNPEDLKVVESKRRKAILPRILENLMNSELYTSTANLYDAFNKVDGLIDEGLIDPATGKFTPDLTIDDVRAHLESEFFTDSNFDQAAFENPLAWATGIAKAYVEKFGATMEGGAAAGDLDVVNSEDIGENVRDVHDFANALFMLMDEGVFDCEAQSVFATYSEEDVDGIIRDLVTEPSYAIQVAKQPGQTLIMALKKFIAKYGTQVAESAVVQGTRKIKRPEKKLVAERGNFSIDGEDAKKGWTFGDSWNGFECPYFEKPEADMIAKEFGGRFENGEYLFPLDPDEPNGETENFSSQEIDTTEGKKTVWAIGAWGWTWSDWSKAQQ